ncbi:hypothetical protein [Bradyrhizobium sp. Ec3.3]|uniref:hypothetical protein n=1 Tax=unclassified Bradyrhizobium TaxID=2631580 RepID=UPI000A042727
MRIEDVMVVVFAIEGRMSDWPSGTLINRNGPELWRIPAPYLGRLTSALTPADAAACI